MKTTPFLNTCIASYMSNKWGAVHTLIKCVPILNKPRRTLLSIHSKAFSNNLLRFGVNNKGILIKTENLCLKIGYFIFF